MCQIQVLTAGVAIANVKLESRRQMTIAYIEHVGSYGKVPFDRYIGQLYGRAKESMVMPGFNQRHLGAAEPAAPGRQGRRGEASGRAS